MVEFEEVQPEVVVTCSRCGNSVKGLRLPGVATAGFYELGGPFDKYFHAPEESTLCDACMWADPAYIADYGSGGEH